jgi:phage protein D
MIAFLNMNAQVTLGNVRLKNVSQFEISENILEMSNTAKITIPRNYALLKDKPILEQFKVGDKVTIEAGYNGKLYTEFIGYVKEIDSDIPLVINCEDETFLLRRSNYIKSYRDAALGQILTDIVPADLLSFRCDDVHIGKYQIDNASGFAVLQDLMKNYGLYSSIQNGVLKVGLAYDFGADAIEHKYVIGKNVKKNELKYKRAEDTKVRVKVSAKNANGKYAPVVIVGDKESEAAERGLNLPGPMQEYELRDIANGILKKIKFDGYTGSITGFGSPRTHAGDALSVIDELEPDRRYRDGKYLIEKVDIAYNESSGFSRQNTLSYKIENTAQNA